MDNLAEQLIEANEKHDELDELGLLLPRSNDNRTQYNYLVARAFKRNPHLHTRHDRTEVWNGHTLIRPTRDDIVRLTDWLDSLPRQAIVFVYDRIKELAPELDEDIIVIAPHLAWSFSEQRLIESEEPFNVITEWK